MRSMVHYLRRADHMRRARLGLMLACCGAACTQEVAPDPLPPPHPVQLSSLRPTTIVPGTSLVLSGRNFSASASHFIQFSGVLTSGAVSSTVESRFPIKRISSEEAQLLVSKALFESLGEGRYSGTVEVLSENTAAAVRSNTLQASLTLSRYLTPQLSDAGRGLVYLNSLVPVVGGKLLLGAGEGHTWAEVEGCFLPLTVSGACEKDGAKINASARVTPTGTGNRDRGTYAFAPGILGIKPGNFKGTLALRNLHFGGKETRSSKLAVSYYVDQTKIDKLDPATVSLGQYLHIQGAGFVGGSQGSTSVGFSGTFTPTGAAARQLSFDMVLSFASGSRASYVLEEQQGLGSAIDLRKNSGVLRGSWTPTVYWNKQSNRGQTSKQDQKIAGVKQVVWVRFTTGYSDSLRQFGLASADSLIRQRILAVARRDYKGINVEFRESEPKDFKLYVRLDIGGKDPNGLGLLGYDNTPGKDVGNKRLYDWIGGVNSKTQQDGFPGYGGVFLESLLGFSENPPAGVMRSPLHTPLFDEVFDTFRSQAGKKLTSAEVQKLKPLTSGAFCPSAGDRLEQAACAIWVLGNVIGSTVSHELGHSFGLAEPYGPSSEYHNAGDLPNRLMEAGSTRPFAERAELNGKGPAVFCIDEYSYLRGLMPVAPKIADPVKSRPKCD